MKRLAGMIAVLILVSAQALPAGACVGRTLNIGALNAADELLLAEILSNIINERTGTTINVRSYQSAQELYEAVARKEVDITVENTSRAMQVLNRPEQADADKAYQAVRAAFDKEKGLVWLKPFGFQRTKSGGGASHTAPLLRREVFGDFPALPRVIDKLGGLITDEAYAKMVKSVESGEKPRKAARDFLKAKKLI